MLSSKSLLKYILLVFSSEARPFNEEPLPNEELEEEMEDLGDF